MKIGLLTGGGDAPGLNAVTRAITVKAIKKGHEVIGFKQGWKGALEKDYEELTLERVEDIHRQGGTILGSSRTNVAKVENGFEILKKNLAELGIDVLVAIGGDDTLGVAQQLHEAGGKVVGVPKTIDNDLSATDYTFGFDTAINRAAEALDRLHTTAKSHHRVFVVELMGRDAGWVTLHGGIAGGAHFILIPEEPFDSEKVCDMIKKRHDAGHVYTIVAVAEGAMDPKLASRVMRFEQKDEFGHVQLSKGIGVAEALGSLIEERTGLETRSMVLGHLQRGGDPSAFDRVLGTRLGLKVVDLIEEGKFGHMASLRGSEITSVPIAEAIGAIKKVSPERYEEAKTFFG
jgi:phosphofructokinase-like protein